MFQGLLKAVTEHHDVRVGIERRQPQSVGHEEHRFTVVTGCLDAVVAILVQTF